MVERLARELEVTEKTIKVHRGRVMKKMGAQSLAELVRTRFPTVHWHGG